jgi:dATP pyrophosphohydrolase
MRVFGGLDKTSPIIHRVILVGWLDTTSPHNLENIIIWTATSTFMRLPVQIEAIIFRRNDSKIEYLLLKRVPERNGFWQPVTGGLEEGETQKEALCREIREETGIKNLVRVIEGLYYFEFSDPNLNQEYVYGVEVSPTEKIVLDGEEHSEYRWCSFQGALQLLRWKENKAALRKLNMSLKRHQK